MTDWPDVADLLGELSDSDDNDEEKKIDAKQSCTETFDNGTSVSGSKVVSSSIFYLFITYLFVD